MSTQNYTAAQLQRAADIEELIQLLPMQPLYRALANWYQRRKRTT